MTADIIVLNGDSLVPLIWIGTVLLSTFIGMLKSRPLAGLLLGILLGPIGAIIIMLVGSRHPEDGPEITAGGVFRLITLAIVVGAAFYLWLQRENQQSRPPSAPAAPNGSPSTVPDAPPSLAQAAPPPAPRKYLTPEEQQAAIARSLRPR